MTLVAKSAGRPHGIALSPNGRMLYVANSDEHNVRAYDLDRNGEPSNERVLVSEDRGRSRRHRAWTRRATSGWPPRASSIYSPEGKQVHFIDMHDVVSELRFRRGRSARRCFIDRRAALSSARVRTAQ